MAEDAAGGLGEGFVHLRVHSAFSLLEGAIKAEAIGRWPMRPACRPWP